MAAGLVAVACGSDDDAGPGAGADAGPGVNDAAAHDGGAAGPGDATVSGDTGSPAPVDASADGDAPDAADAADATDAVAPPPPQPTFPFYFNGGVGAVTHLGNAWYFGGAFTRTSAYAAPNFLPLDASGLPAACAAGAGFDGPVHAFAVDGSSVYVGGAFTHYKGVPALALAKLDATTCALDATFATAGGDAGVTRGFDAPVQALLVSDGSLYVGGEFLGYDGTANAAAHLARLDARTGALDTAFAASAQALGLGVVRALAASGAALYAASDGVGVFKVDLTTGAPDRAFANVGGNGVRFAGVVHALAVAGPSLYVGGDFTYSGAAFTLGGVAKLDAATGALDPAFDPPGASPGASGFDGPVYALAVAGGANGPSGALYAGGSFGTFTNAGAIVTTRRVAKLDAATGTLDVTFNGAGGFDERVTALAVVGTALYAGGEFSSYGPAAASASHLAKLDATSGALDPTFGPAGATATGFDGETGSGVNALALSGGHLWVGGSFALYAGHLVNHLAKLDDVTYAVDTTFSPGGGNGFDGTVSAFATTGGALYVGGAFARYRGSAPVSALAKLDPSSGALDSTFTSGITPPLEGPVYALSAAGSALYVGGAFPSHLAKIDPATGARDETFAPGLVDYVTALATDGNALFAAGGINRPLKVGLASGTADVNFIAAAASFNGPINAIAVSGPWVYLGGAFTTYGGTLVNRVAKLAIDTGNLDPVFDQVTAASRGFDGTVYALDVLGSSLYAGGVFTSYRGVAGASNRLAKLALDTGALDTTFSPPGANGFDARDSFVATFGASANTLFAGGAFSVLRGETVTMNVAQVDPALGVSGGQAAGAPPANLVPLLEGDLDVRTRGWNNDIAQGVLDLHGSGLVWAEYAKIIQASLNRELANAGLPTHSIGAAECTGASPARGCTSFETFMYPGAAPAGTTPALAKLYAGVASDSTGFDRSYITAQASRGGALVMSPGVPRALFCPTPPSKSDCFSGELKRASRDRVRDTLGAGDLLKVPAVAREVSFYAAAFDHALTSYLKAVVGFGLTPTLAEVDAIYQSSL